LTKISGQFQNSGQFQDIFEISGISGLLGPLAGLVDNRSVIDCRMAMRAAVVEPVGRKAYWSLDSVVGGARIAG